MVHWRKRMRGLAILLSLVTLFGGVGVVLAAEEPTKDAAAPAAAAAGAATGAATPAGTAPAFTKEMADAVIRNLDR